MHTTATIVYKISSARAWHEAETLGAFAGSADDVRDGFIHLSAGHQVEGTLAKHFRGQPGLVVVAFEAARLGAALKWEVSRGGDPFPHLYAPLETRLALWVRPLPLSADGVPVVPECIV